MFDKIKNSANKAKEKMREAVDGVDSDFIDRAKARVSESYEESSSFLKEKADQFSDSYIDSGLDGIKNKIHPGDAMDKDLYDLPPEEDAAIPKVCHALDQALAELDKDRAFLTEGGVFTDDMIDGYIALKMEEVTRLRMETHPAEFDLYYSV